MKLTEFLQKISLISSVGFEYHLSIAIDFTAIANGKQGTYEIRITAPDSVKYPKRDENDRVSVAVLPWIEFNFYREDPGEFNLRRLKKLSAQRDKQM
ncbi:MAG TPA: hypothetical protein VEI01_18130 [Terriglobales bacterium]|nr:hypothetical protein [Terriglobales bacterium]